MNKLLFAVLLLLPLLFSVNADNTLKKYQPNWPSVDSRPLPPWFDESKIGIFLHWGVFSVPSFSSEWFWSQWQITKTQSVVDFMSHNFRPGFTYQDFAPELTAEFYDPNKWAEIIQASGAKYVVLTSKHHEGYTLWPSSVSWNWNSVDVGPKRDLLGDLADAIRNKTDVRFGLYHSMFEWFNPLYLKDKANLFQTNDFVTRKTMPELIEIVNKYKPEVIWSDGDWEAPPEYWNATGFLSWLYNDSPVKDTVVVNDRWGIGATCHHGGYYTCSDKYNPGTLQAHKFENAMTVDLGSWGYRRNAQMNDYMTIESLIATMTETVSCGGNILINVGPTSDGRIAPIFEERLRQLGSWLAVNGEAIYGSVPWLYQNDTLTKGVWYTEKKSLDPDVSDAVYAIVLNWPKGSQLTLGAAKPSDQTEITMLGVSKPLQWQHDSQGNLVISLPYLTPDLIPCQWAWVIKFQATADRVANNIV